MIRENSTGNPLRILVPAQKHSDIADLDPIQQIFIVGDARLTGWAHLGVA